MKFAWKKILPFLTAAMMIASAPCALAYDAGNEEESIAEEIYTTQEEIQTEESIREEPSEEQKTEETAEEETDSGPDEMQNGPQEQPQLQGKEQREEMPGDEEPAVQEAESIDEYIRATQPDTENAVMTVDKKTGKTDSGETFKEIFGESYKEAKAEGIVDAIEDTGDYVVTDETKEDIKVSSLYGAKRLLVLGKTERSYGESSGSFFEGETVLQFATESDTEKAYKELVSDFGDENVIPDIIQEESPKAVKKIYGWGSGFMGLDYRQKTVSNTKHINVVVMDSGIRATHEVFAGRTLSGYNLVEPKKSAMIDPVGHGTMTAGIIAESTPSNVDITMIKVMDNKGMGSYIAILQAMDLVTKLKPAAVNMSFGGKTASVYKAEEDKRLKKIADAGTIICAAAGNENSNLSAKGMNMYPAESPYTVCVGSVNYAMGRSSFSNYGSSVDFTAPGEDIIVPAGNSNRGYCAASGTSLSCPYITACAALCKIGSPKMTKTKFVNELKRVSKDRGAKGKDVYYGWGVPRYPQNAKAKDISKKKFSVSSPVLYTGKSVTPKLTTNAGYGTEFTYVARRNVNIGKGLFVVQGNNGVRGMKVLTFKIVKVLPVKITSAKAGKRCIYLKCSKGKDGYEVYVKKQGADTTRYYKFKSATMKITGLKSNAKYNIKVKTYKKEKGKTYFSAWSPIRTVKVK